MAATEESVQATAVSDAELRNEMKALLQKADLQTTSEKQLRKQLEAKLGCDLTPKKQMLRECVEAFLAEQEGQEEDVDAAEEEEEEEEEKPKKAVRKAAPKKAEKKEKKEPAEKKQKSARTGSALGSVLSAPLAAFLGVETMPRPQVVAKLWEYIKANNLQNPKNKRKIILDDKLKTIFTHPMDMFSMNKQLSKHCKTGKDVKSRNDEDDEDDEDDEEDEEPQAKKAKA